jgi:hypothetical protein
VTPRSWRPINKLASGGASFEEEEPCKFAPNERASIVSLLLDAIANLDKKSYPRFLKSRERERLRWDAKQELKITNSSQQIIQILSDSLTKDSGLFKHLINVFMMNFVNRGRQCDIQLLDEILELMGKHSPGAYKVEAGKIHQLLRKKSE